MAAGTKRATEKKTSNKKAPKKEKSARSAGLKIVLKPAMASKSEKPASEDCKEGELHSFTVSLKLVKLPVACPVRKAKQAAIDKACKCSTSIAELNCELNTIQCGNRISALKHVQASKKHLLHLHNCLQRPVSSFRICALLSEHKIS
jgi:hypothetical protein